MSELPHNRPEFDSVPTPDWFLRMFEGWHDPFPLNSVCPVMPQPGQKVFANPGYSRKERAADLCIEMHKAGHYVVMLVPIETSTKFAKKLIQYGVERLFFDRRIFPNLQGSRTINFDGRAALTGAGAGLDLVGAGMMALCRRCYGKNDRTCMKPQGHKGKHGSGKRRKRITLEDVVLTQMARRLADIEFENAVLRGQAQ